MINKKQLIELNTDELRALIHTSIREAFSRHQQTESAEQILNAKQAAALLNISLPTLHKWKKDGTIPVHRKGGRIYFMRNELVNSFTNSKHKTHV